MPQANFSRPRAVRSDRIKAKVFLAGGGFASAAPVSGTPDASLRRAVLTCLIADPMVSAGHIAVAASAGAVTLSGYVTSHAQKGAASAATQRVKGVERVADEVHVAVPYPVAADQSTPEDEDARPHVAVRPPFMTSRTSHAIQADGRRPEPRP